MADNQPEKGWTKITNQTLMALARTRLSGREWCCLAIIWRLTYGWQGKKSAHIPISTFHKLTGILPGDVSVILKNLEKFGVIERVPSPKGSIISFVKDYDKWTGNAKVSQELNTLVFVDGGDELVIKNANSENANSENAEVSETAISRLPISTNSENAISTNSETTNRSCPSTPDFMRPAEGLKKVLKKVLKKEEQQPSTPTPITSFEKSERSLLAEALGKLQVSEAEFEIWKQLRDMNEPCTLEDVREARTMKKSNLLTYLQNIVCEFRDVRLEKLKPAKLAY